MKSKTSWVGRRIRFVASLVEAFDHELRQARQRREAA